MQVTVAQVLAWRLKRQFLSPRSTSRVVEVVGRLCGVQAQVASAAQSAIAARQQRPDPGAVAENLKSGVLIKTWAMRGTLHLCRSDQVGGFLALMAAARTWAKPSWQKTFGATPDDVERLTAAVCEILPGRALSRDDLVSELLQRKEFRGLENELRSGWATLLKPLAWQGALCHGIPQDGRVTFTTPSTLIKNWPGLPEPNEAASQVIASYLGAYGSATPETFDAWLSRGASKKGMLRDWFAALADDLTEVEVGGSRAWILAEHADDLAATRPTTDVHLLGPFDAYVLGAGTKDAWMLPPEHRGLVSRAAGWISPVILAGGRIVGTWELQQGDVVTSFFPGERALSAKALEAEIGRVSQNG